MGHTLLRLDFLSDEALGDVEHLDVVVSEDDGVAQLVADELLGLVHLCFCDGKAIEVGMVELPFIFPDRLVATLTDVSQHCLNGCIELVEVEARTLHDVCPLVSGGVLVYFHLR